MPKRNTQTGNKPTILKIFPEKKAGESQFEYEARLAKFYKNDEEKPEEPEETRNRDGVFILPQDKERLIQYMKDHPETKLFMSAGSQESLRGGLRDLKEIGCLGSLVGASFPNENGEKMNLEGRALQKEKDRLFPQMRPRPY